MEVSEAPLYSIEDYREFLKRVFDLKRGKNPRFSFRQFAALVGFRSPNYLQMILDGRRNLSVATAELVASRLKLNRSEADLFVSLVRAAQASTPQERGTAERQRLAALKKLVTKDIPSSQRVIFSKWYYLLVRELFFLKNRRADPKWVCDRLGGLISETEAANAIDFLVQTGFLEMTDQGLKAADPVLDTDDAKMQAALLRTFHVDVLKVWSKNLAVLGPDDQELGLLNIPISSRRVPQLKEKIRQFQDEIIGWVQDEKEADQVVQLGTYLIPFPPEDGA